MVSKFFIELNKKIIIIGVVLPLFFLILFPKTKIGENLNYWWLDLLYVLRGAQPSPENIVIVAIDEPSFKEIGLQWPWPRSLHAQVVNNLKKSGAKAIVFDVLFVERSKYPNDDDIFAKSLKDAGNVILGKNLTQIKRDRYYQIIDVVPFEKLRKYAKATGYVNFTPDPDGIIRHGRFILNGNPTLSFSALKFIHKNKLPPQHHSLDENFLIDFRGPSGNIKTVSYYQVLEMDKYLPKDYFKNKIVFIGLCSDAAVEVSKGAVDAFPTPFFRISRKAMFGVEIHANTFFTMEEGTPLIELNNYFIIFLFFILSFIPIFFRTNPQKLIIYAFSTICFGGFSSYLLFVFKKLVIYMSVPIITVIIGNIYWGLIGFISTYREKRKIKEAFDKYVPSAVVNEVLKNPQLLKLGGEKRELTVLFSDIRGFTSLSENLEPEKLVFLLNEYLTEMTEKVFKNNGLLDKFIGDAVMAIFGAPLPQENHAHLACKTALDMVNSLSKVGVIWKKYGLNPPKIGIGINTGFMVVGNMGSFQRFDYTVIGDEVNLASRLEGLNKVYGTTIIVGENTYNKVKNDYLFRELDFVKVKGKAKPVRIYELLVKQEENEKVKKIISLFSEGLNYYREGKWDKAVDKFKKIVEIDNNDAPSRVFIERCEILMNNPPSSWDGVWTMTTK